MNTNEQTNIPIATEYLYKEAAFATTRLAEHLRKELEASRFCGKPLKDWLELRELLMQYGYNPHDPRQNMVTFLKERLSCK